MNAYLKQIKMSLLLTVRNKASFVFGYGFPLAFFFLFSAIFGAGSVTYVTSMVLTTGVLGAGFFGASMQAIVAREQNTLRRFKVAPITPGPILVAAIVGGLVQFLPMSLLVLTLANRIYHAPFPEQLGSLFLFIACGVVAFCTIGSIISAVVNSMQEAQILINLLYMPMLMLSGATFPITSLPEWVQTIAQFLPSAYFMTGVQSILRGRETFLDNLPSVAGLLITTAVGSLLAFKLFRGEKEEKMKPSAKLWLVAVLAPFLAMGVYEAKAKTNIERAKLAMRDGARNKAWLIHDARVFVGDGSVLDRASVLVKGGKVDRIFIGDAPDAKSLDADVIEAAGKTLLPGLIDAHVHLGSAGFFTPEQAAPDAAMDRELAAYLYSGVTAVKSVGDALDTALKHRATVASGAKLGAELFLVGPMFTAQDGHGTEFFQYIPEQYREAVLQQMVRLPQSPEEARAQVADLKTKGVDGIKVILESGAGASRMNRLDGGLARVIGEAARAAKLPLVVHTGAAADVEDALAAGARGIEHGSMTELFPDALFARMKAAGMVYDPTLAVVESLQAFINNDTSPLDRSLVRQVVPAAALDQAKAAFKSQETGTMRAGYAQYPFRYEFAEKNLQAAYRAGVTLVPGTDAGNPMMVHGPGLHRELQLWVKAGVPPATALRAATYNAARLLGAENRFGRVQKGFEANLLLVDGNPLEDIAATERISAILFKGERIDRTKLFDQK